MDRPRGDYVGNVYPQPDGKLNRNGLLDAAKAAATAAKVLGQEMDHGYGLDHASTASRCRQEGRNTNYSAGSVMPCPATSPHRWLRERCTSETCCGRS